MKRHLALVACLLVGACAGNTTSPRINASITLPSVPDADLTCADEPDVPQPRAGEPRVRESQVQNWILDLRTAGADCRSKLSVVRGTWRAVENKQAEVSRAIPPDE